MLPPVDPDPSLLPDLQGPAALSFVGNLRHTRTCCVDDFPHLKTAQAFRCGRCRPCDRVKARNYHENSSASSLLSRRFEDECRSTIIAARGRRPQHQQGGGHQQGPAGSSIPGFELGFSKFGVEEYAIQVNPLSAIGSTSSKKTTSMNCS